MANGYSIRVAEAIRSASDTLLGVRLGLACLERDVPVTEVAQRLGVTRPTVYSWFYGESDPTDPTVRLRVEQYVIALVGEKG
jgi:hypothetical protein